MYIKLFLYAKKYRFPAILNILSRWINSLMPIFIILLISNFWTMPNGVTNLDSSISTLDLPIIILLSLACLFVLASFIWPKDYIHLWSQAAINKLSKSYIESVFAISHWGAKQLNTADILQDKIYTIEQLAKFYEEIFPRLLIMILNSILLLVICIFNGSLIFILPIVAILLMSVLNLFVRSYQKKVNHRKARLYVDLAQQFMEDLDGMNTLLMYGADDKYQEKFAKKSRAHSADTLKSLAITLPRSAGRIIIAYVGIMISGLILGVNYANGKLSLSVALTLLFLIMEILFATRKFSYFNKQISILTPIYRKTFDLIESSKMEVMNMLNAEDAEQLSINTIDLKNLSFQYDDEKLLLDKANLRLERGNIYTIVGKNGAGKSTIAKLICKQLIPSAGEVLINGQNNQKFSSKTLSNAIGVLNNDPFLFKGDIISNLDVDIDSEKLQQILELGLLGFVEYLPDKWHSEVGENGKLLSPGQRQQIAFARLILQDKSLYIFDEATSNIDQENSNIMLNVLRKLSYDNLVINITHNWSDIKQISEIIFLDNKQLIKSTHDNLLENNFNYRELFDIAEKLEAEKSEAGELEN